MTFTKKFFADAAKKGQNKLREEIGEEAYLKMKRKYGKKGGRPKGKPLTNVGAVV